MKKYLLFIYFLQKQEPAFISKYDLSDNRLQIRNP